MRDGVTESNPWGKYDPSGIEIMNENQKNLDDELNKISSSKKKSEEITVSGTAAAATAATTGSTAGGNEKGGKDQGGSGAKKSNGGMFSGMFGSSKDL